ncbi:hypothetical protein SAMN05216257_10347 [Meinhardsimonia xiamenensis]|jgi:hypothetical protein|uniref:Uncharacterized protein n=1 Tax=Meinhardsimonia xiamenensis TaxID=990712 RepID=A0A1G9CBB1_9RHOB|nr:hypothetical protein [Meinhardsimonia xiamenensis]PRX38422.1 hypothetical protein LV81_00707 [Meinhardsimonia xiamenensis]SDK48927.1 hypothetical protein SAMN05216257_10347 [Meinhardsimonia xiamenensis]
MKRYLITTAACLAIALSAGTSFAGIGNGKGVDKGNKNGWEDSGGGYEGLVPKGLNVSGDNGRTDKGKGNGGENLDGNTPNKNGEFADGDNDDDPPHGN